jgi:hypothetical protein
MKSGVHGHEEPWREKPQGGNRIHCGVTACVDRTLPRDVPTLEVEDGDAGTCFGTDRARSYQPHGGNGVRKSVRHRWRVKASKGKS